MAINGIDPATFNPNAGREEAYNNRWQTYLTNLGQTQNKINVKKARKYFDQQFEQDWNNEAASREIDFISQKAKQNQQNLISKWRQEREAAELASQEQDARDYEAAGYTFDLNKGWVKPTTPQQPAQQPVRDKNGRTKEEVRALQQEMLNAGYDLGKYGADGIWGPDTQLAYDMYIQQGKKPFKEAFPEVPATPATNNGTYYTDNAGNRYSYTNNVLKKLSEQDTEGWTNGGFIKDMDDFKKSVNFWSNNVSFGGMDWSNPYYLNNVFRYTNNDPDWNGSGSGAQANVRIKGKDGVYPLRVWNNRSFAIDVANNKAYELEEDIFGEVDGRGNDSPINTYDLYSFFNNYTPEEQKRLQSQRLGGSLNHRFKVGEIIKQILKNSNVFPYNIK